MSKEVNKKLFEKSKKGPFNRPMFFKTIKEGFEYFAKFNKPKQRLVKKSYKR